MGSLTRAQIVSQGLYLAGNTSLTTQANTWLNFWLRDEYAAWPWPFLQKRLSGIALAAGATALAFGAGSGGEVREVLRIIDPVWLYDSSYMNRKRVRIRQLLGGSLAEDETVNNPANFVGLPETFKARKSNITNGLWSLVPAPVPDKAYLVALDYLFLPGDPIDGETPIYPSDKTMVQAVKVQALGQMKQGDEYMAELQILQNMVIATRMRSGDAVGVNDVMGLDQEVYR